MTVLKVDYVNGDTYYADATAGAGSGVNAIATQINTNTTALGTSGHDHDGTDSSKLDVDLCFSDFVHSHASNAEGGTLTWANIFSAAGAGTHTHASTTTGGTLDWDNCWADGVHSHTSDAEGGTTLGTITVTGLTSSGTISCLNGQGISNVGHIIPNSDGTYTLGNSSYGWDYLWVDEITADWNISPRTDTVGNLGTASKRWDDVYCVQLNQGDQIWAERDCPICKQQFKEGEAIIDYVLSNFEEGTRCVPAHLTCCLNQTTEERKEKHSNVIQHLKEIGRFIDPIAKRARKIKEAQERETKKQARK